MPSTITPPAANVTTLTGPAAIATVLGQVVLSTVLAIGQGPAGGGFAGAAGQVQYSNGAGLAASSKFTFDSITGAVSIAQGTLTASAPGLNLSQTWNGAGVAFTAWKLNVTDTASAAGSLLADWQVGGVSQLALRKDGLLQFGGSTSAFPALKRNAAGIDVRLADDSGYAALAASNLTASVNAVSPTFAISAAATAYTAGRTIGPDGSSIVNLWYDVPATGTHFFGVNGSGRMTVGTAGATVTGTLQLSGLFQLAGTTSSFPALKRNGTGIEVRLADDSALTGLTSGALNISGPGTPLTVNSTNSNVNKVGFQDAGVVVSYWGAGGSNLFQIQNSSGVTKFLLNGSGQLLPNDRYFGWSSTADASGSPDLALFRDGAGILSQRNSTNPQTFNLFRTYADASNYERMFAGWVGASQLIGRIGTEALGTGVGREMEIGTEGVANLNFRTSGVYRMRLDYAGHFGFLTDNTYDIGLFAGPSNGRPRSIYAGTSVIAPVLRAQVAAAGSPYLAVTETTVQDWSIGTRGGVGKLVFNSGNALGGTDQFSITNSGVLTVAASIVAPLSATAAAAPTIASAATIAPTTRIVFISGTTAINTITAPAPISTGGGTIILIPTGLFTTGTSGNIAIASTAVVSKALHMTWDVTAAKWYPSY
jgi:hypothetical protein